MVFEDYYNKWFKWIINHPKVEFTRSDNVVSVIDIVFLTGYEIGTIKDYLYAYRSGNPKRSFIKNKIDKKFKGDAQWIVTVDDLADFLARKDFKGRLYDTKK